jgi:hypothetical protein
MLALRDQHGQQARDARLGVGLAVAARGLQRGVEQRLDIGLSLRTRSSTRAAARARWRHRGLAVNDLERAQGVVLGAALASLERLAGQDRVDARDQRQSASRSASSRQRSSGRTDGGRFTSSSA